MSATPARGITPGLPTNTGSFKSQERADTGLSLAERLSAAKETVDNLLVEQNLEDLASLLADLPEGSFVAVTEWPEEPYDDGTYDVSLDAIFTSGGDIDRPYGHIEASMIAGYEDGTTDFDRFKISHPDFGDVISVDKFRAWQRQPAAPATDPITQATDEWRSANPNHLAAHNHEAIMTRAAQIEAGSTEPATFPEPEGPRRSWQHQAFLDAQAGSSIGALARYLLDQQHNEDRRAATAALHAWLSPTTGQQERVDPTLGTINAHGLLVGPFNSRFQNPADEPLAPDHLRGKAVVPVNIGLAEEQATFYAVQTLTGTTAYYREDSPVPMTEWEREALDTQISRLLGEATVGPNVRRLRDLLRNCLTEHGSEEN